MKLSFVLSFQEILNVIEIAQDLKDPSSGSNDVWLYGARGWVEHDSHLYFNTQFRLDFYWQSNYKKVSEYWTNWAPGEPNYFNKEQGCLHMRYINDYRWDDDNCERKKTHYLSKTSPMISDQLDTLFFLKIRTQFITPPASDLPIKKNIEVQICRKKDEN